MASPISIAEKMANALNRMYNTHIVLNTSKFFGKEGTVVTMHVVKDCYGRGYSYNDVELFRSASSIYTCLFMRDLLYSFQDKDIPEGDEGWQAMKEKRKCAESIAYMKGKYLGTD